MKISTSISSSSNKKETFYVFFLALLAATPALATDMYLSAIPIIADEWGVGKDLINLSLVLWFISFSVFLLVFGPLSDKYGRKPILICGMSVFVVSTFLCSLSQSPVQIILFRILQGISAAAPSAMGMAICRDKYDGKLRQKVLAYIGVILSIAPIIAPSIGALILKCASWRFIFIAQGCAGIVPFVLALTYQETNKHLFTGKLTQAMLRYKALVKNRRYLLATLSMGLIIAPFYAYLAFSPIAYISLFEVSEQLFGILFGIGALAGMTGAFVCSRLVYRFSDTQIITACLIGCCTGGLAVIIFGSVHYVLFALCICIITFFGGMSRPVSNNIILEQVNRDFGSASSFLIFYQFVIGAPCMYIVSLEWTYPFLAYGIISFLLPGFVLLIWPFLLKRIIHLPHVTSPDESSIFRAE